MARSQQDRLLRQFFSSMPTGARIAFFAGIFFCFAPLGLLQSAMSLQVIPWWEVMVVTTFSGLVAIVYTATAIRAPRWMPLPIAIHFLLMAVLDRSLPERGAIVHLDDAELAMLAQRLRIISALTIGSVMGAFVCFFSLIRREGLRFTGAHAEIRLAREIHTSLVPAVMGSTARVEWRGTSRPSGDVGGDLVDVVLDSNGWTATVADVSGHGVAAGVLMGMFKTAFRSATMEGQDIGQLLSKINAVISPLRQPHMFITAACLRLTADGALDYVLAGHPPMLHLSASTGRSAWVGESQLALALMDPTVYSSSTLPLAAGDVVVVVTDGLLEVFDRNDRELGLQGLQAAVERAGPAARLDAIETAIFDVCRDHGTQLDDQTVLILRTLA
jgi:serine phosphatase RsbU (regulator of sigma subunit)